MESNTNNKQHPGRDLLDQRVESVDYSSANPLSHVKTKDTIQLASFSGTLQPGLYPARQLRRFGNPAPLGLAGFALTTFVQALINISVRGVSVPTMIVGPALSYGGLAQLLAGMW